MSYDNSNSAPGSDSRGRLGRSEEVEEREAGPGGNPLNNNGDASASEGTNRERGSSPGSGGSSGGDPRGPNSDDTDGLSSGNDSRGRPSTRSSHGSSNGKDSAMLLETTDSNKSSTSQIPSPPSSSLAYSLLSGSSEQDPPSTSGCSSDQSARVRTQKELMKALRELKIRLPAERRGKGHSSTLEALKYALNCVKQVRANQEYYHQWSVEECHDCSLDLSTFTIEELDNITSEYTLKNTDTFSMAVSFLSGKVVYISPQGSSLLRCKPERLQSTIFSELLAPQDVSTFYSSTAPCRLPAWAACIGSVSPSVECTQEKSMFCRISADRAHGGEMRYYPFRLTPYQLTLRDSDSSEPQPCCLLIAERVHSGYEAPRIPTDKRIFTTSHTPSCLFQEVDERAVPLLGYLPQDLVGTPVLLYLHPEDRPIMVAIHKKILQFAGQPFDHAPLRMCARSGEYLTIDTSWSSFVNPWSRKVAFIVGRHKVRTSPLNEDVFTPPRGCDPRAVTPEVVQLSEQIHRLLVQPVHSGSSQGYSSLGSSASRGSRSHERPHLSAASSSDSNGPADAKVAAVAAHNPMTFQQICKDVHMVKTNGQQVFIESRNRAPLRKHAATGAVGGLRAIGGTDPIKDLIADVAGLPKNPPPTEQVRKEPPSNYSYQQINCLDSIIRYLDSCNVPNTVKRKCGSSSCTASSTSDDDKKQETSSTAKDIVMEEAPPTPTPAPPPAAPAPPAPPAVAVAPPSPAAQPEREGARRGGRFGLTKEVLSAHTQQEEQAFLCRFRDLSQLRVFDPASALRCPPTATSPLARGARCSRDYPAAGGSSGRRRGRGGKRLKHQESSDQRTPLRGPSAANACPSTYPLPMPLGAPTTSSSWPTSVASQASLPSVPYPPGMLPIYPIYPPLSQPVPVPDPSLAVGLRFPALQTPQIMPPMMTLVLPNYMFPQLNPSIPQMAGPMAQPGAAVMPPGHQHFYNPNAAFPFAAPMAQPLPMPAGVPVQGPRAPSRSSTPQSCGQAQAEREGADSPLFQSRCSSPLNLLQLEESPSNRLEVATALVATALAAAPSAQGAGAGSEGSSNQRSSEDHSKENENGETNESNQDVMSTSSDLLDLLLQEDSRSGSGSLGTGSSGSGSGSGSGSSGSGSGSGSGSNGCSSSGSGTRSSQSSHTSKYFGSIDSSENDHSRKPPAGGASGDEQFIKSVLQDPIWLLMANTNDTVMMTYQMPVRDMEAVLRQDREALRPMQKHQPRFTEEQKRELSQVHPWIRTGRLPRTINVSACMGCKSPPLAAPYDVETHEMELGGVLEATEEGAAQEKAKAQPDAAMDEGEASHGKTQGNDQEMTTEEQEVTSQKAVATVMTH
ncbi:period circadian protein homolog 1b isoform X2 [Osmerus mordax]|uniref:period circadian protein homolog 1b isoform X2 n=1 Tax=Osmerus mordax TaxID=8014 RepID=UPI0035100FCB